VIQVSILGALVFTKSEILPDVQKFSVAINAIKACLDTRNPSELDVHCMAIEILLWWFVSIEKFLHFL
jgi:hypothetical protein